MDEVWFALRWVNIALYGGVLSGLLMHWRFLLNSAETPTSRVWLWSLVAVGMYGTVEVVWLGQPGGFRIILMTFTLGGLFISLWLRSAVRTYRLLIGTARKMWDKRAEEKA